MLSSVICLRKFCGGARKGSLKRWVRFIYDWFNDLKYNLSGKTDLGDILEKYATNIINDCEFKRRAERFPDRTPQTHEEYWYRKIFEETYCYEKIAHIVHTKVYRYVVSFLGRLQKKTYFRTASWHLVEEKENISNISKDTLNVKESEIIRFRRRSTGSMTLSAGVA